MYAKKTKTGRYQNMLNSPKNSPKKSPKNSPLRSEGVIRSEWKGQHVKF